MTKIILILFLGFTLSSCKAKETTGDLWYISNSAKGNGSADSWANSASYINFDQSQLSAGDTVYIDGGTDSLVYNLTSVYFIKTNGTNSDYIVWTRGKDAGHNGTPVITTSTALQSFYLSGASYTEVSYLKFRPAASSTRRDNLYLANCIHIDIKHNEFNWTYGTAVTGNPNSYIRILNNYFVSEALSEADAANAIGNPDPIRLSLSYAVEIAYNEFHARSRTTFDRGFSKDIIQLPYHNLSGGPIPSKIHNNFVTLDMSGSDCSTDILTIQNGGGSIWFYNNIIVAYKTATHIFQMFRWPGGTVEEVYYSSSPYQSLHAYNNTIILSKGKHYFNQHTYFRAIDTVAFKNNVIYFEESRFFTFESGHPMPYLAFNNNQYETASSNFIEVRGVTYTYANWKKTFSQDVNSDNNGFTLLDDDFATLSVNAKDYQLAEGSSGINEGTDLSSYFTNDYQDTVRTDTWDTGAFER
jgi:hypothetical protein